MDSNYNTTHVLQQDGNPPHPSGHHLRIILSKLVVLDRGMENINSGHHAHRTSSHLTLRLWWLRQSKQCSVTSLKASAISSNRARIILCVSVQTSCVVCGRTSVLSRSLPGFYTSLCWNMLCIGVNLWRPLLPLQFLRLFNLYATKGQPVETSGWLHWSSNAVI